MNWFTKFLDWIFPWRKGSRRIYRSIDQLEGIVVELHKGTVSVTNQRMTNDERLEKKEKAFEKFKKKIESEDKELERDANTAAFVSQYIQEIQKSITKQDEQEQRTEYPT